MSEIARSFAKAKLVNLPPPSELPLHEDLEREDDSSSASSMSSTGTVRPTSSQRSPMPPVQWTDFFAQELYLENDTPNGRAKFHVYITPPTNPKATLFALHHGAGSTGLSFSIFAQELRKILPDAGIISVDAREHGSVVWEASGEVNSDLSIELLSQDFVDMLQLTASKLGWLELPSVLLVGHSLGGAVVTEVAKAGQLGNKLLGYAVLDVVEGSALETVKQMHTYLAMRPVSFPTVEAAIDWHIRSRTIRNPRSARASVPSLLKKTPTGTWTWKTDVTSTEPYWENWFQGMSNKFLSARGAKLLLLAGTDRLDKELMIGQMQGMRHCEC